MLMWFLPVASQPVEVEESQEAGAAAVVRAEVEVM
jgi:hypothetical protein